MVGRSVEIRGKLVSVSVGAAVGGINKNSEDGKIWLKRQIHVYSAQAPKTNKGAINTLSLQSSEGQEAGLQPLVNSVW